MGFIPIFLTMTGALVLFFLSVKNTLQRKLNLQKELLFKLKNLNPALGMSLGKKENYEELIAVLKAEDLNKKLAVEANGILKEMKINRHHFNQLISRPPYHWIAKIAGFHPI